MRFTRALHVKGIKRFLSFSSFSCNCIIISFVDSSHSLCVLPRKTSFCTFSYYCLPFILVPRRHHFFFSNPFSPFLFCLIVPTNPILFFSFFSPHPQVIAFPIPCLTDRCALKENHLLELSLICFNLTNHRFYKLKRNFSIMFGFILTHCISIHITTYHATKTLLLFLS